MPIIRCDNLRYRYPESEALIFNDVHFQFQRPGFHALFGHSGAGKTTLARMIAGEISGYEGRITFDGIQRIFYTHNMERLPNWASAGDILRSTTPTAFLELLDRLIAIFGLQSCLQSRFGRLSLGQKNRINLTRYLVQPFDALVLDESLANVDETTRGVIISEIKSIFPQRCFIYISHNMLEVSRYCDEIVILRSAPKTPQVVSVCGLNETGAGTAMASKPLEAILLEIAHAT
ncbi:ATP-binding cassette domain-containing protein [Desulfatirhabdium butyrativorans]|uniref:ATP-binding cassette domain-containing protein n=1 Tax=Desulfatirhabdium butyrativorans TaxID=340467 RepID=UPI000425B79D|nr:ATP-binding cassette domain-containing protein [Desulfatirhabdium butyrativorans]